MNKKLVFIFALGLFAYSTRAQDEGTAVPADQEFHVDWINWDVTLPEDLVASAAAYGAAPEAEDEKKEDADNADNNGEFHVDWDNWDVALPDEPAPADEAAPEDNNDSQTQTDLFGWEVPVNAGDVADSSSNTSFRPNGGN